MFSDDHFPPERAMEFCDLDCKYASFPKTGSVDGSGSCRTFIALYCKKRKSLVHKNLPCGDKAPGEPKAKRTRRKK